MRKGTVIDGPFAETKEQLLGFYVLDCANRDAAVEAARELQRVNPGAVYEIREIRRYIPGAALRSERLVLRMIFRKTAAHFSGSCATPRRAGSTSLRTTSPKKASSQKYIA